MWRILFSCLNNCVVLNIAQNFFSGSDIRHGLQNIGNSCFVNSLLQALLAIPSYRKIIGNLNGNDSRNDTGSIPKAIKLILGHLLAGSNSLDDLSDFVKTIRKEVYKENDNQRSQQDPSELFRFLAEGIDLFNFKIKKLHACTGTKVDSQEEEPEDCDQSNDIVEIQSSFFAKFNPADDLETLSDVIQKNLLEGVVEKDCEKCSCTTYQEETNTFIELPAVMCIQISQVECVNGKEKKIDVHFDIPEKLTLKENGSIDRKYELVSRVVHEGDSARSGHYYAYAKYEDQYRKFNDKFVTSPSIDEVNKDMPYLLFYKLCS
eukprot:TRINITY_DN2885_c0_g1_i6.p1 TRINITY_DN2885_c0_g1~~TRINITY_DN2885_c0_g1_i6.p1  ORF type:complete len:319 (+),score=51.99 TRINITY_DN2885_c0_g1_i6:104-1060(+)